MTVLLFDIDGTLVRTGGAGKAAMEAALCEEFGVSLSAEEVPYSGRTDRAIGRDLLRAHGLDPTDANQDRLIDGYLRRLPGRLQSLGGEVCPGVRELLARLRQRTDVRLGLLTGNVRRGAELKLGHFDLWAAFPAGGFGDYHEDRDDVARAAVRALADRWGPLDPADVWVIGDTPLDVRCARAVGANAVAVATGWHPLDELKECGADLTLADLSDPAALPASWGL
jgi:phosphoglycolate phosphatase-like HAD superfamily hydrolase